MIDRPGLQSNAVLREFREAVEARQWPLADRIMQANPDLTTEFHMILDAWDRS